MIGITALFLVLILSVYINVIESFMCVLEFRRASLGYVNILFIILLGIIGDMIFIRQFEKAVDVANEFIVKPCLAVVKVLCFDFYVSHSSATICINIKFNLCFLNVCNHIRVTHNPCSGSCINYFPILFNLAEDL